MLNSINQNYTFNFKWSREVEDINYFRLLIWVFLRNVELNDCLKNWFDFSTNFTNNYLFKEYWKKIWNE